MLLFCYLYIFSHRTDFNVIYLSHKDTNISR